MESFAVALIVICGFAIPGAGQSAKPPQGYIRELRSESRPAREARHREVAGRRAGPVVMVHRGASSFAPENTIEAYAAAMDCGADGCEIDLRRSRDGVLVLFHDDMLDRLTEGLGTVNQLSYHELMSLRPRLRHGRALPCHGPPTFVALLELARQRAMLLHLDIKEPGLEDQISALLDAADAWDHVVAVNTYNATNLLRHPKLKLLTYKTGLYAERRDVDPEAVRAALQGPGQMIIVDDPRVAARELQRPAYRLVPLPKDLCVELPSARPSAPLASAGFNAHALVQSLGAPTREKVFALLAAEFPEAQQPDGDDAYQRRRLERIVARTWAAQNVVAEWKTPQLVGLLERQVKTRSLHRDFVYHGLDGAMAVRTLATIRATESAPALIDAFWRVDPELKKVADPQWSQNPLAWTDFRLKMELLTALGDLTGPESKAFLEQYVALEEGELRESAPPQYEDATKALLRQRLSLDEGKALLRHRHSAVRGTAILEFLDDPTPDRTKALADIVPWALELPGARK